MKIRIGNKTFLLIKIVLFNSCLFLTVQIRQYMFRRLIAYLLSATCMVSISLGLQYLRDYIWAILSKWPLHNYATIHEKIIAALCVTLIQSIALLLFYRLQKWMKWNTGFATTCLLSGLVGYIAPNVITLCFGYLALVEGLDWILTGMLFPVFYYKFKSFQLLR